MNTLNVSTGAGIELVIFASSQVADQRGPGERASLDLDSWVWAEQRRRAVFLLTHGADFGQENQEHTMFSTE